MKRALVVTLLTFVAIEAVLVRWAFATHTAASAVAQLGEPVTLIMLTDFTFFAGIVFVWMFREERKRGAAGWPWLPAIIIAPTIALIAFLLRQRAQRPPME